MGIKSIFIIILDISGYTRFISEHKLDLLHAESIIGELMEAVIDEVQAPIITHEILGDAVTCYALNDDFNSAQRIYEEVRKYFEAFWTCERGLVSECTLCHCSACSNVGQLKLKAILHVGDAAFTQVKNIQKISGSSVITAHRLLKNSIASDQYILMTEPFFNMVSVEDVEESREFCEGLGEIDVYVHNLDPDRPLDTSAPGILTRIARHLKTNLHSYGRLLGVKKAKSYQNLPRSSH